MREVDVFNAQARDSRKMRDNLAGFFPYFRHKYQEKDSIHKAKVRGDRQVVLARNNNWKYHH